MLALPIGKKMLLYIYLLLCPHYSEHQKNAFQSIQSKHFHQKTGSPNVKINSNKVKLPKVGSKNAIGPNKQPSYKSSEIQPHQPNAPKLQNLIKFSEYLGGGGGVWWIFKNIFSEIKIFKFSKIKN